MKKYMKQLYFIFSDLGIDPLRLKHLKNLPRFIKDLKKYRAMETDNQFNISWAESWPLLSDYDDNAGLVRNHYFHQDLWASRKIYNSSPREHIDIGSRLDGFISNILTFMDVTVIDVRPLDDEIHGLNFICDNAATLNKFKDNSIHSLSTLHAAEHFGLGRYGDPVDPNACFQFMKSLQRVLSIDGKLYFSVPIGRERVQFNAHRVFKADTILNNFNQLDLISFSYIDDKGIFHENADINNTNELNFGCGLFEFTKRSDQ